MRLISRTLDQIPSPISASHALLQEYNGDLPLLDLSQGVPNYATAPAIADHIAKVACTTDGGRYTNRPGLTELRELVAKELSVEYAGAIKLDNVLITAGCNQAFCLAISALVEPGDEVILPVPYYFNHDMWLRLERISPIYLQTAPSFMPDPIAAEALITNKTRAIVLVTPGNPTGITISPSVVDAFAILAQKYDIVLIIDETYRVFRASPDAAHNLFRNRNWGNQVVSLHSFSKEFAIRGHRVGAVIAHPDLIVEMMKLFDCISICAPRLGQEAVIAGLSSAKAWRDQKVTEMRDKQEQFESIFVNSPGGYKLCSAGAFFGWVRYSDPHEHTNQVVRRLLLEEGILVLPGTIFMPGDDHYLRFSFANLSSDEINELGSRLKRYATNPKI
jgi:aspartate/methionine/tyrosine aminotransferase